MKESKWYAERFGKERNETPQRAPRGSQPPGFGRGWSKPSVSLTIKTGGKSVVWRKERAGAGTPAHWSRLDDRNALSDHLVAYEPQSVKTFSPIVSFIIRAFAASSARFRFASPI